MVSKILTRLDQKLNPQTPVILILLGGVLVTTCLTLTTIIRELSPPALVLISVAGLLLGWLLAAAKPLPGWLAGLLIFALGAELISANAANLEPQIAELARQSVLFIWNGMQWSPGQELPNLMPVIHPLAQIWIALNTLFGRLVIWLISVATGSPTSDPVVSALVWSLGLWGVSAWAGWITRRLNNPMLAILPAGTLLATVVAYHPKYVQNLLALVGATLLLMGVVRYTALENRWQANNIDYASFKTELAFIVIPVTMFFVFLSGFIPSVSIQKLSQNLRDIFKAPVNQAGDTMQSLGVAAGSRPDDNGSGYFFAGLPQQHLLGSGPELGKEVALLIDTGAAPLPPPSAKFAPEPPRYYWRGLTYDKYTSRGWSTQSTGSTGYKAGEPVVAPEAPHRNLLTQTVQVINSPANILYAAGNLVTANHPFSVRWRSPEDPFAATIKAAGYQALSLVPQPASQQQLRMAGTNYPDHIRQHYLELPDSVPDRVRRLAKDLTATSPTPYDRALSIEAYLRQFPYSLDLPTPPQKRDMVDYFLFDLQTGYCDYYASAMVVLARASGVPAKIVTGYAGGTYDPANTRYVVTEANAHSWPEIYFPEYGWVAFEPTAAQPIPPRLEESQQSSTRPKIPPLPETQPPLHPAKPVLYLLILPVATGLLFVASLFLWWMADFWRLRRLAPPAVVVALYNRLQAHGRHLIPPSRQAYTPYEFAERFATRIGQLARHKRWGKTVAPATQDIHHLTKLYVQTTYSTHPPTQNNKAEAIKTWQHLRRRLWLSRIIGLMEK